MRRNNVILKHPNQDGVGYTPQQIPSHLDMCVDNNGNILGTFWDAIEANPDLYNLTDTHTGQYIIVGQGLNGKIDVLYLDELGFTRIYSMDKGIIQKQEGIL